MFQCAKMLVELLEIMEGLGTIGHWVIAAIATRLAMRVVRFAWLMLQILLGQLHQ